MYPQIGSPVLNLRFMMSSGGKGSLGPRRKNKHPGRYFTNEKGQVLITSPRTPVLLGVYSLEDISLDPEPTPTGT